MGLGYYPEKGKGQNKMNRTQAAATYPHGEISTAISEGQGGVRAPFSIATTLVTVGT